MKFFHINNSLCIQCDKCVPVCPTLAVYTSGDNRYINYDKCTSCGNCMKQCSVAAITVETLENTIFELEKNEQYRQRIRRLENEMGTARQSLEVARNNINEILSSMSSASFIIDPSGKILRTNRKFTEIAGLDPANETTGDNIYNVLPEHVGKIIRITMSDTEGTEHVTELNGMQVSVTMIPLSGNSVLGLVDNLEQRNIAGDKILDLIRGTINRKMSLVQRIGSLLGEETSEELNELNTVIKIIEASSAGKNE